MLIKLYSCIENLLDCYHFYDSISTLLGFRNRTNGFGPMGGNHLRTGVQLK